MTGIHKYFEGILTGSTSTKIFPIIANRLNDKKHVTTKKYSPNDPDVDSIPTRTDGKRDKLMKYTKNTLSNCIHVFFPMKMYFLHFDPPNMPSTVGSFDGS